MRRSSGEAGGEDTGRRRDGILDEERAEELRRDGELEAEFQAHIAHRVERLVADGVAEDEARRRAWEEFGDAERLKDEARAAAAMARPRPTLRERWRRRTDGLRRDLRSALRQLRQDPGFALVALLTLALGVGGATTLVSVVQAVVLEPLPFAEPDRVVAVEALTQSGQSFSVAEPQYLDWRDRSESLAGLAAWWVRTGTLRTPSEPRSVRLVGMTHDLLPVLGLEPVLGRGIRAEEDRSGEAAAVALLGHDAWVRDWGADPEVLGRTLEVNGRAVEVVGVAPPGLEVLVQDPDLMIPMGPRTDLDLRGEHSLSVVGRLAPGATAAQADEELDRIQTELAAIHQVDVGWTAQVHEARPYLLGERTIQAGWILLGAAGLLLLMACVNVANLLLARATTRAGELGIRQALGAGRARLAGQLLTESAVLAALGGVLGLGLTYLALPAVKALGAARIPRLELASVDATTLGACLASVALAALAAGSAPILRIPAADPARALGSAGRNRDAGGSRARAALVAAQVALTVVLLVGSGLLFRSFTELSAVDPGFEPEGTLAVRMTMPDGAWSWEERRTLVPLVREAVLSAPGVEAAGATAVDPFSGMSLANFVAAEDRLPDRAGDFTPIAWRVVTPGFFEAMGMELHAGRTFRRGDGWQEGAETPVVVSQRLAGTLWPDGSPVGRTLVWGDPQGSRLTVVGVVEELRDVALDEAPRPTLYRTHEQISWAVMTMVARVQGDPTAAAEAIRARIREAVPELPVPEIRSLEANLDRAVAEPRFNLTLLSGFAFLGLVMAVVGIYGLTAFDVRRRFREIGIRVSLGARPESIQTMIVRRRLALAAGGTAVGMVLAWVLARWLESLLYGVSRADPITWGAVVALVAATSAVAAWVPARRATRVDPREVLQPE